MAGSDSVSFVSAFCGHKSLSCRTALSALRTDTFSRNALNLGNLKNSFRLFFFLQKVQPAVCKYRCLTVLKCDPQYSLIYKLLCLSTLPKIPNFSGKLEEKITLTCIYNLNQTRINWETCPYLMSKRLSLGVSACCYE